MTPPPAQDAREHQWAAWMRATQAGDQIAYRRLLNDVLPVIRRQVRARWRRAGQDSEGFEDVVQDILLTLHQVRHTYDPDRPFSPWLAAIVRFRLTDALRRQGRRARREIAVDQIPETFSATGTNTLQDHRDDLATVRREIERLPDGQRQAVELLKLRDLSLKEASAVSGMSVAALKVATHRAYRSLRRRFGQEEEG